MKLISAIGSWVANHKKLTTTILAAAVNLIPDSTVDQSTKQRIIEAAIAYIVGQGIADHGKEAALVRAASGNVPAGEIKSTQTGLFPQAP